MQWHIEPARIFSENEQGQLLAEITFPPVDNDTVCINHTFVSPSLRGQGVAQQLMEQMAAYLQQHHQKAIITCPFASQWFRKHAEYHDCLS